MISFLSSTATTTTTRQAVMDRGRSTSRRYRGRGYLSRAEALQLQDYESLGEDEADLLENAPPTATGHRNSEASSKKVEKKKAPGFKRKRSKVWTTFTLFTDADKLLRAKCSKCGYTCLHESKNGTGNLLKHQKACVDTKDIRQMVLSSSDGSMTMRNILFDPQEFDALDDEVGSALEKTELDRYLEEKRLNRNLEIDILEYWRTNQFRFPLYLGRIN